MPDIYQKSGYLNSPFRLFYLEDLPGREYTYHYHDFHKLLIFLNGTVSYRVEGREYDLKPGDQVLIPAGEIHCPVVHPSTTYTRLIAYISPDYFSSLSGECDLSGCFSHALEAHENLIRIPDYFSGSLYPVLQELIGILFSDDFGTPFYQKLKFAEYLLLLNRYLLQQENQKISLVLPTANPQILQILDYINAHLTEDLSIDRIADAAFLNRSYLMHLFRDETRVYDWKICNRKTPLSGKPCHRTGRFCHRCLLSERISQLYNLLSGVSKQISQISEAGTKII